MKHWASLRNHWQQKRHHWAKPTLMFHDYLIALAPSMWRRYTVALPSFCDKVVIDNFVVQVNFTKAEEYFKKALKIREEHLGPNHSRLRSWTYTKWLSNVVISIKLYDVSNWVTLFFSCDTEWDRRWSTWSPSMRCRKNSRKLSNVEKGHLLYLKIFLKQVLRASR